MKTIWKYQLEIIGKQEIKMLRNSEVLGVQMQYGEPVIWVLVDLDYEGTLDVRTILIYGTGYSISESELIHSNYVGTFQKFDGGFIGHVFERSWNSYLDGVKLEKGEENGRNG